MPITASEPLVIDPVEAQPGRLISSLWANRIVIVMPDASSGFCNISLRAYDETTGEVIAAGDETESLRVRDLPLAIAEVPEAAAALTAILAAIPALRTWQESRDAPAA